MIDQPEKVEGVLLVFWPIASAMGFWVALDTQRFFRWFGGGPGPYPRWQIALFKVLGFVVGFGAIYDLLRYRL